MTFTGNFNHSKSALISCCLADGQRQEVRLGGGASRHCFYDLTPSSQYQIIVHAQIQETEGPSVSITDMTRMLGLCLFYVKAVDHFIHFYLS